MMNMGQKKRQGATEQHFDVKPNIGNARLALPLLVLLFSLFALPQLASAVSCGNVPTQTVAFIYGCIPVNVINTQAGATAVGFSQEFSNLPFNALVGNAVLYNSIATSASNALLPCWVESSSIMWCNLLSNTIPGSGSANGIYFFELGGSSTSFFSATSANNIGEAPQYSATYGKYDNGNTVFTGYQDFYGTSTPTGWTTGGSGCTTSVSNGIHNVGGSTNCYAISTATFNVNNAIDWYGSETGSNANFGAGGFVSATGNEMGFGFSGSVVGLTTYIVGVGTSTNAITYGSGTNTVFTNYEVTTTAKQQLNYIALGSSTTDVPSLTATPLSMGFYTQTLSNAFTSYWIRARVLPPSQVMPTTTYGTAIAGLCGLGIYCQTSTTSNPTAYETSSQTFSFNGVVSASYATANMLLQVSNGVATANVGWSNQTVSASNNLFTFNYNIPLLASNNIAYTFTEQLYTTSPLISQGAAGGVSQTEYENYFPMASILSPANSANVLLGSNVTFNTIITQVNNLNAVTVAGYIKIGNRSVSEYTAGNYIYWANAISFVSSQYNLANPTLGSPSNVVANSIVQLTYNSNSVFRNVTNLNFQIYNESLVPCGGSYTTNTITWKFYNVSDILLWPGNVLVQGHFVPILNSYSGSTQSAANVGFGSTATANVYNTCIYPSWAKFNITGVLQYSATGSLVSNYNLNARGVSNVLSIQRLYMESQPAPVSYDIYTLNQQTQVYVASQVNVYSYYIGNDSSILLSTLQVPAQSGGAITLEAGNQYTFAAYSPNGQTYYATQGPLTAQQCSASPCSYIIYLDTYNITNPTNIFAGILSTCSQASTGVNQITESCTYSVKNGSSLNLQLYGYKGGVLLGSPFCLQQATAASGTLSCVFNQTTTKQYNWQFTLNLTGAYQPLQTGSIGTVSLIYGSDSLWFAVLIILTLVMLFLTRNIIICVILFDVGWTAMYYLGLINASGYTIPFLWILSAVLLYLLNRKG